jgi:hypothetical protein
MGGAHRAASSPTEGRENDRGQRTRPMRSLPGRSHAAAPAEFPSNAPGTARAVTNRCHRQPQRHMAYILRQLQCGHTPENSATPSNRIWLSRLLARQTIGNTRGLILPTLSPVYLRLRARSLDDDRSESALPGPRPTRTHRALRSSRRPDGFHPAERHWIWRRLPLPPRLPCRSHLPPRLTVPIPLAAPACPADLTCRPGLPCRSHLPPGHALAATSSPACRGGMSSCPGGSRREVGLGRQVYAGNG